MAMKDKLVKDQIKLSEGEIEKIASGSCDIQPILQVIATKKITTNKDRYRIILSDGKHSYSHVMLTTTLNFMIESGEMDTNCVIMVKSHVCNQVPGDSNRRVMILLDVKVLFKGSEVCSRIGNPQPLSIDVENNSETMTSCVLPSPDCEPVHKIGDALQQKHIDSTSVSVSQQSDDISQGEEVTCETKKQRRNKKKKERKKAKKKEREELEAASSLVSGGSNDNEIKKENGEEIENNETEEEEYQETFDSDGKIIHPPNCYGMLTFNASRARLQILETLFDILKDRKKENKTDLHTSITDCIEKVKKIRQELNELLDRLEQDMVNQLREMEDKLGKQLDDHMTRIDVGLNDVQEKLSVLNQCEETGNLDYMFIAGKKFEKKIPNLDKEHDLLESSLLETEFRFIPDKFLTAALTNLNTFGRIEWTESPSSELLDVTVSGYEPHNIGCVCVYSAVFMPPDHVVLACGTDGLKLLDNYFRQISHLPITAQYACKFSDTEILLSQGGKKQIQFVEILPRMVPKKIVNIDKTSFGICYHKTEEIYVACQGDSNDGEIQVFNSKGELQRTLGVVDGKCLFTKPWDVKVSSGGDRIFVSDFAKNTVTCLDKSGQVIFTYSDKGLLNPLGMYIDNQDNLLVCGARSSNFYIITKDGNKCNAELTMKYLTQNPYCVSVRQSDGCLAIGMYNQEKIGLMTIKTCPAESDNKQEA